MHLSIAPEPFRYSKLVEPTGGCPEIVSKPLAWREKKGKNVYLLRETRNPQREGIYLKVRMGNAPRLDRLGKDV